MTRKAYADRGVRTVESGFDPAIVPVEDEQSGDEGTDEIRPNEVQDRKEPLDPPEQPAATESNPVSAYEGRTRSSDPVHPDSTNGPATGVGAKDESPIGNKDQRREGGGAETERD